jgi:plasmid stabilization system protein ParE
MPRVRFAPGAIRDLQRLQAFLRPVNAIAARRAAESIVKSVQLLGRQPQLGRPVEDLSDEYREWIIDFGDSGYVARYRIDADAITVLAVRHQRETGC